MPGTLLKSGQPRGYLLSYLRQSCYATGELKLAEYSIHFILWSIFSFNMYDRNALKFLHFWIQLRFDSTCLTSCWQLLLFVCLPVLCCLCLFLVYVLEFAFLVVNDPFSEDSSGSSLGVVNVITSDSSHVCMYTSFKDLIKVIPVQLQTLKSCLQRSKLWQVELAEYLSVESNGYYADICISVSYAFVMWSEWNRSIEKQYFLWSAGTLVLVDIADVE